MPGKSLARCPSLMSASRLARLRRWQKARPLMGAAKIVSWRDEGQKSLWIRSKTSACSWLAFSFVRSGRGWSIDHTRTLRS